MEISRVTVVCRGSATFGECIPDEDGRAAFAQRRYREVNSRIRTHHLKGEVRAAAMGEPEKLALGVAVV